MRICFSIQPDQPAIQSHHFGASGMFTIFDSEAKRFESHPAAQDVCPRACHCPMPELDGIDLVICQGMGHLLLRQFRGRGIPVLQSNETELNKVLLLWQHQQLSQLAKGVCLSDRRSTRHRSLQMRSN